MARKKKPNVQAAEVTYELHSLGWKEFQKLCITVVGEVWGQAVQSYFDSCDGGRDGAFHGTWKSQSGEVFQGTFTVQCKFTSKADKVLAASDLSDEIAKVKRLASRGLADNYILFTNARLTGVVDVQLKDIFEAIPGVKRFAAYGGDRISQIIRESPRLRMLVPRVYGLGDLSQILDARAYAQAHEILSALGDDLAKLVITDAYRRSAKALVEHGFVLLLGEPACGKSTIAAGLAVGALDDWGCSTIKIRDANDFIKYSNPHEPKQLFWVDDAFGSTQFDRASGVSWNQIFPHMQAAIRRGARILFTSRDYIYRSARNHLKESAFPLIHESQVVIRVERLTKEEREQILYNHIRLGTQSRKFKTELKQFLPSVAAHQGFSPEIARRLGNPIFTKGLSLSKWGLDEFVSRPVELLREIIRTLDAGSHSALAVVFMRGGILPSPMTMTKGEEKAITRLGGSPGEVCNALGALEGSLLIQVSQEGRYTWRFKHPTIRDAFASLVAEDRELMDIYLVGSPIEKLFSEVSCGDVGIEGIKVIVPPDRYSLVISRMETFRKNRGENANQVNRFLAYRCDQNFLARFIERNPNFISELRVGSYLYAVSDVDVIVRLHEYGLLPENKRLNSVAKIRELAVDIPDAGFLRDNIRKLLTEAELQEILDHVRTTLLSNFDDCIDDWRESYNGRDDPQEHFSDLEDAIEEYRKAFIEREISTNEIEEAVAMLGAVVEELRADMPPEPDSDDFYGSDTSGDDSKESRSVFDDVDQ